MIGSEVKVMKSRTYEKPIESIFFLEIVVENFRQWNIYFIFKFKSVMNRPGPAWRDALCHAFQKDISQLLLHRRGVVDKTMDSQPESSGLESPPRRPLRQGSSGW